MCNTEIGYDTQFKPCCASFEHLSLHLMFIYWHDFLTIYFRGIVLIYSFLKKHHC